MKEKNGSSWNDDAVKRVKEEVGDIGADLDSDEQGSEGSMTSEDDDDRDVSVWDDDDDDDDESDEDETPSFLKRRFKKK
jgi:hypothetical protein